MSNIKIIKTKEGDIVNGVLYKPFWFGPHINVEDRTIKDWEKMEERYELELLEMEKERKLEEERRQKEKEERWDEYWSINSERYYIPEKYKNKFFNDKTYTKEQFIKDIIKINTRWIRDEMRRKKALGLPLYSFETKPDYSRNINLDTEEKSESERSESEESISLYNYEDYNSEDYEVETEDDEDSLTDNYMDDFE